MASSTRHQTDACKTTNHVYDPWDLRGSKNAVNTDLQQAQTVIYETFIEVAKTWEAADVLSLFRQIFIHCVDSSDSQLAPALYTLLKTGAEEHFHYTLNRVCYILINNWERKRQKEAIAQLVELLASTDELTSGTSLQLRRLRKWLAGFVASPAFKELEVYVSRDKTASHWSHRYSTYLFASQSLNQGMSEEQRLVTHAASKEMKHEFKRNLVMYTLQSAKNSSSDQPLNNPTLLGDHVLPLIQKILATKGKFNCQNLANIFLAQSQNFKYKPFKTALVEYLVFSMGSNAITESLNTQLSKHVDRIYPHYDDRPVDPAILLRTTNQVIECLTIGKQETISPIMTLLLGRGYAMTLAILLLKLVMISPKSRAHLEAKVGDLVRYHANMPEEECQWLIQFLEILQVTFTIYSDKDSSYSVLAQSR